MLKTASGRRPGAPHPFDQLAAKARGREVAPKDPPPLGEVARRAGGGPFSAAAAPESHHQLPPPIATRSPPPQGEVRSRANRHSGFSELRMSDS
ncbi:hypothetical protein DDF65_04505 [Caulobacter radicis]|uniref:Uncharacterized protein n=1 Tax=Caulobacter radicis TaxID=2172650 RepID=A0A2T9JT51_9CAUL|nr:hypothetical protein DDF65_04505 [Caulobacter radicis]